MGGRVVGERELRAGATYSTATVLLILNMTLFVKLHLISRRALNPG